MTRGSEPPIALKPNDVITVGWSRFKLLDNRESDSQTTAHIIRG
jgi:hypothetical protein